MPGWDSELYLRFARERTQPAEDLAARIDVPAPARVIDLGCGPGNSTEVLARRWPGAEIHGLDNSSEMIAAAARAQPAHRWRQGDIATWTSAEPFDVVFANASLQWVPDHAELLPRLLAQVRRGGALAFQVPANLDAPAHRLMRQLGNSPSWQPALRSVHEWRAETAEFYYDTFAPVSAHVELWRTEYVHVLANAGAIVDWYRGTGLRPWLEALGTPEERERFLAEYQARIAEEYPPRADGRVLFPFLRLFVVAYR